MLTYLHILKQFTAINVLYDENVLNHVIFLIIIYYLKYTNNVLMPVFRYSAEILVPYFQIYPF